MGAAVGDVDNDGDADVYVANLGPDRLYRNDGTGRFTDVTAEAGYSGLRRHGARSYASFDVYWRCWYERIASSSI